MFALTLALIGIAVRSVDASVKGGNRPARPRPKLWSYKQHQNVSLSSSSAPPMNEGDKAALLRLRDAQPTAVRPGHCFAGWDLVPPAKSECSTWSGVTCSAAGRVTVIDLRYCNLSVLPAETLAALDVLQVLELRGNRISTLPPTVGNLTSLQRIMIEMNQVSALPKEICTLSTLTHLYIAYNKITALPDCIGQLKALDDIWLRGNDISTLPDSFCDLSKLSSLYIMNAGITKLPDCFGRVGSEVQPWSDEKDFGVWLELEGNRLTSVPDSMADMFATGRLFALELANNLLTELPSWISMKATNITTINVEGNKFRELPAASCLPSSLTTLRLGNNPINIATTPLQRSAFFQTLQTAAAANLTTISLTMSSGGPGSAGWDGLDNDYVVSAMPGMRQGGMAKCTRRSSSSSSSSSPSPSASAATLVASSSLSSVSTGSTRGISYSSSSECAFEIKTDWNSNDYASGGLALHYCLIKPPADGGCGCEEAETPPYPPTCIPLVDNHDGSYTGSIDTDSVGSSRFASFRFFQLATTTAATTTAAADTNIAAAVVRARAAPAPAAPAPAPVLREVVIGMWADGSDCVGGKPDATFQSRGGNCFRNVEFGLDCSSHGPFAAVVENQTANTLDCQCPPGFAVENASDGRWQCSKGRNGPPHGGGGFGRMPLWAVVMCAVCGATTLASLAFAVHTIRSKKATAVLSGGYQSSSDVYEGF